MSESSVAFCNSLLVTRGDGQESITSSEFGSEDEKVREEMVDEAVTECEGVTSYIWRSQGHEAAIKLPRFPIPKALQQTLLYGKARSTRRTESEVDDVFGQIIRLE